MSREERLRAALRASPEMTSTNMGSMDFGIFPMAARHAVRTHAWEPEFLEMTRDYIFADIEHAMKELGQAHGTRFEFECCDLGHPYDLAHVVDQGWVEPPFFVQMVFGILGGVGAEFDNLMHMHAVARRLFGDELEWSVLAAGRHQMPFAMQSALLGGNLGVGLAEGLWIGPGRRAASNAGQGRRIRGVVETLELALATPEEARERLGLKGGDRVASRGRTGWRRGS